MAACSGARCAGETTRCAARDRCVRRARTSAATTTAGCAGSKRSASTAPQYSDERSRSARRARDGPHGVGEAVRAVRGVGGLVSARLAAMRGRGLAAVVLVAAPFALDLPLGLLDARGGRVDQLAERVQ